MVTSQSCRILLLPTLLLHQPHLRAKHWPQLDTMRRGMLTSCSAKRWSARLIGGGRGWSQSWQTSSAPSPWFCFPSSSWPPSTFSSSVHSAVSTSFFGWKNKWCNSISWAEGRMVNSFHLYAAKKPGWADCVSRSDKRTWASELGSRAKASELTQTLKKIGTINQSIID